MDPNFSWAPLTVEYRPVLLVTGFLGLPVVLCPWNRGWVLRGHWGHRSCQGGAVPPPVPQPACCSSRASSWEGSVLLLQSRMSSGASLSPDRAQTQWKTSWAFLFPPPAGYRQGQGLGSSRHGDTEGKQPGKLEEHAQSNPKCLFCARSIYPLIIFQPEGTQHPGLC